jgi:hypothetical protein
VCSPYYIYTPFLTADFHEVVGELRRRTQPDASLFRLTMTWTLLLYFDVSVNLEQGAKKSDSKSKKNDNNGVKKKKTR